MFDSIVQELAVRFGLEQQAAAALLRQTLAYATKADHGALAGFISKFEAAGLGSMARSWLGGPEGAQSISPAQLETVLGHGGGLISQLVSSTGLARQSVTPALGYLLPAVVGVLTPEGQIPALLPAAVSDWLAGTGAGPLGAVAAGGAVPAAAQGTAATLLRWIPWLVLVLLALGVLGWCSQKTPPAPALEAASYGAAETPPQTAAAAASVASAASAAQPAQATPSAQTAAQEAPLGAGVVAEQQAGKPMLKVYFDVSRAQIAPEFAKVAEGLLAYLQEHPEAKLQILGFNDPTGNALKNAKLSKQRAEAVRAALLLQGVAAGRMELVKPVDAAADAAAGANHAELRRVEVRLQ